MNSFYGVLAARSFRFAYPQLAEAITSFGQHMLKKTRTMLEEMDYAVLYGDTDSLFVDKGFSHPVSLVHALREGQLLANRLNRQLAEYIQQNWQVTSYLVLEFEKFYRFFLLPSMRHSQSGRAKGYAGWREAGEDKLEIVGLEAVRSDWTPLAKTLQKQLLTMLFREAPTAEMAAHVKTCVSQMEQGSRDGELVFSTRLHKPLSEYRKTTPPHVKAARLLPEPQRTVRYVMTLQGPQPLGYVNAPLDYDFYRQRQVFPIVAGIAPYAGLDAQALCRMQGGQGTLFS